MNLPNMSKYPQNHLEIPQVPVAVLAMDNIGHLPITSKRNQWALTAICMPTPYVFAILMKEKAEESVVQTYLSGTSTHKGGSIAILSDNGTEFKNADPIDACKKLSIKRLYSNPFHPQGNSRIEKVQYFLKITLKFLDSNNLEWVNYFHLLVTAPIFPSSNGTEPPSDLCLAMNQQKGN